MSLEGVVLQLCLVRTRLSLLSGVLRPFLRYYDWSLRKSNGSRDLPRPFQGVVCHPWAIGLEVSLSISARHEDMKYNTKRETWGVLG